MESVDPIFLFLLEVLIIAKELLINEQIKVKEARMLDENGNQLGIMPLSQARAYAFDHGVDLVLIAPQATPPVCLCSPDTGSMTAISPPCWITMWRKRRPCWTGRVTG